MMMKDLNSCVIGNSHKTLIHLSRETSPLKIFRDATSHT